MTPRLIAAVLVLAAAVVAWRLERPSPGVGATVPAPQAVTQSPAAAPAPSPPQAPDTDGFWGAVTPLDTRAAEQTTTPSLNKEALAALRATRNGDPRAPAHGTDERLRSEADARTRANYDDYRQWQQQFRLAGYARYVAAAGEKLNRIDAQLAWGAENGVSAQDLAAAREKRQRLAAARDRLVQEHPELAIPDADSLAPTGDPDAAPTLPSEGKD